MLEAALELEDEGWFRLVMVRNKKSKRRLLFLDHDVDALIRPHSPLCPFLKLHTQEQFTTRKPVRVPCAGTPRPRDVSLPACVHLQARLHVSAPALSPTSCSFRRSVLVSILWTLRWRESRREGEVDLAGASNGTLHPRQCRRGRTLTAHRIASST